MVAGIRKYFIVAASAAAVALVGICAFAPVETSLSAVGMGPVLPLPGSNLEVSLADVARDPEALRHKPEDEADASRLAEEIKEMRDDLAHAQGPRALELHEQAYLSYAALGYYLEDVAAGRGSASADRAKALSQLAAIRGYLAQHAQVVVRSGSPAASSRAQYHLYALQYLGGSGRSAAVSGLRLLAKDKGLPATGALKKRAALLVALYDLDHGGERAKAQALIRSQAGSIGGAAQVAVRLLLARSLAGVSAGGHKTAAANAEYRGQLAAAAQKAQTLSQSDQAETLAYVVTVWHLAEGARIDWAKPPFKMAPYAASPVVKAVVERSALADWAANRKPQALRKYQSLARSANGTPQRAELDLRVLDMHRSEFAASKAAKPYEAALLAANKTYLDTGVLGDGHEAQAKSVAAEVTRRHHDLVHGELARAAQKTASPADRKHAIAMAYTYVGTLTDAAAIEDVKARIAGLYALSNQHHEAVTLYKELAETSQANSRRYWALAVRSQSVLANWSEPAPWGAFKSGNAAEREELLVIYGKFAEASGKDAHSWFFVAQAGLLQMSLGRVDEAFTAWQTQLKLDTAGPHAANAAGTMLSAYQKAAAWSDLEALARLCLAHRIAPAYHGASVGAEPMLALALLEGGKQALADNKFDVAVLKLKEFVAQHQTAKNHDEGFFLLSVAFHGAGRHDESVKTLLAFVDRYPRSGYYRQALLNGADWSAPMAYEENVMFFGNRFLKQFASDPDAARVRVSLTELYVGRAHYAEAVGVLQQTVRFASEDAVKAQALAVIMDLEERHGDVGRALAAALKIIGSASAPDDAKANAYALKARLAASAGRYAEVQAVETQLAAMQSPAAQDALGEARYLLAVQQAGSVVKQYFNLALTDPSATLAQRYTAFQRAQTGFRYVCDAGQTSFCAPAMLKLSQLSMDFMKSIEDIAIQDTLAKERVQKFRSEKQGVMNAVSTTSQQADAKALAAVSDGNTDPDWTEAVLWQNATDWNFDRVSGETGNGYVQWGDAQHHAAQSGE